MTENWHHRLSALPRFPTIARWLVMIPATRRRLSFLSWTRQAGFDVWMDGQALRRLLAHLDGQHDVEALLSEMPIMDKMAALRLLELLHASGIIESAQGTSEDALSGSSDDGLLDFLCELRLAAAEEALPPVLQITNQDRAKLEQSKVLILGMGGVGSRVIESLACAGVGQINVAGLSREEDCDPGWASDDVGRKRIEALRETVKSSRPTIQMTLLSRPVKIDEGLEALIGAHDVVMAVDDTFTPEIFRELNKACLGACTPWIRYRIVGPHAEIGPLVLPFASPCYRCFELGQSLHTQDNDSGAVWPNNEYELLHRLPALPDYLMPGSAFLVGDVLRLLVGLPTVTCGKLLSINLLTYESSTHPLFKFPRCPDCRGQSLNAPSVLHWDRIAEESCPTD